jgi:hypothetical protein
MARKFLSRTTIGTALTTLTSAGIIYIGARYLAAPQASAATFGVPAWPHGEGDAFLSVKGVRDVVSGLVMLAVLAKGSRRTLGWAMLAESLTPIGDMLIVLNSGGKPAIAFGVHGATAAAVILAGALLVSGSRSAQRTRSRRLDVGEFDRPAAQA